MPAFLEAFGARFRELRQQTYVQRQESLPLTHLQVSELRRLFDIIENEFDDTDRTEGVLRRLFDWRPILRHCDDCGTHIIQDTDDYSAPYDGEALVCADCRDHYYRYHERSDMWVHESDDAYPDYESLEDVLHSYNANPLDLIRSDYCFARNPRDKGKDPVYYGVELEVELSSGDTDGVLALKEEVQNFAICKHDGSLDHGFEICTVPATLNYHRYGSTGQSPWAPVCGYTRRNADSYYTSTCGIHVHVSRSALTPSTIFKMQRVIEGDAGQFMQAVADRVSDQWAAFVHYNSPADIAYRPRDDKYLTIRLDKADTVEFRIFKGNATFYGVISALEAIDSLRSYALQTSIKDANPINFLQWLNKNKHAYRYFYSKIQHSDYSPYVDSYVDQPRSTINTKPQYV